MDHESEDEGSWFGNVSPPQNLVRKWMVAPFWIPEEGIALAYALDPAKVVKRRMYDNPFLNAEEPLPHLAKMARRAILAGELSEHATPVEFIKWAIKSRIRFHRDWRITLDFEGRRENLINSWSRAPEWTLEEGCALSLSAVPTRKRSLSDVAGNDVSAEYNHRLKLVSRAAHRNTLPGRPAPAEFIEQAELLGFPFHRDWRTAIELHQALLEQRERTRMIGSEEFNSTSSGYADADPRGAAEVSEGEIAGSDPSTRVRATMLKILLGSAVAGFGYDAMKSRNSAAKEISSELERLGIPVSDDTIRKYLTEAAELVDPIVLRDRFDR